ncbi:MAG: hypothetical protein ACE5QV_03300, partial [Fidelibacterota bacterium]
MFPHGFLYYYGDGGEYYLSGGIAGDWFGFWFQSPDVACSLYAFEGAWYSYKGGGTINLHVYQAGKVSPDTVPGGDSIAPGDIFGEDWTPEGITWEIKATSGFERLEFYPLKYFINPGRDIFWIAWEKTAAEPMLLADDSNPGDYLHTWSYEPNQDGDRAWSHYGYSIGIEAFVRAEVVFYEDAPPKVHINIHSDAYENVNGYKITGIAFDKALDPRLRGVKEAFVSYSIDEGVSWDTSAAEIIPVNDSTFEITGYIPPQKAGTAVIYKIIAIDLNGGAGKSKQLSFKVIAPENRGAGILLVNDGGFGREDFYLSSLQN